ncbi:MAG: serine protein kinase RIO [Candidatus Lokiarchaeota archaeon]|nr:serine protein kinase RIO [Candidatus Lokiarchaeota archaeon]
MDMDRREEDYEDILSRFEKAQEDEDRKKRKDSDELKVVEGVIDPPTLKVLYNLLNRGIIDAVHGIISAGKEANVYRGQKRDGTYVAIKIYRMTTAQKEYMQKYIAGDPRFKRVGTGARSLIPQWANKEFKNLLRFHEAGVRVPEPIAVKRNVLVMEFIGDDEEGLQAPLLKDIEIPEPDKIFNEIMDMVLCGYRDAEIVHADLSEFNIMWYGGPVLIDVSQAVLKAHPHAKEFLFRDIENLARYFGRLGVETEDPVTMVEEIVSSGGED